MNSDTSVQLLTWHVIYGGYVAAGHQFQYMVTRDSPLGWVALYQPPDACPAHGPYSAVPFGRMTTRRHAQRLAEEFERKSR